MASHMAFGVDKSLERTTPVVPQSPHSVRHKLSAEMIMCTAALYVCGASGAIFGCGDTRNGVHTESRGMVREEVRASRYG